MDLHYTAPRTYVVTGAASGIGAATVARLTSLGHRVIGVDLHRSDVEVDLGSVDGRHALVAAVGQRCGGTLDAVVAAAGTAGRGATDVRVDHFGAVATLEGLRPLLAAGRAPRAVVVASVAATVGHHDEPIVDACLAGDEELAVRLVEDGGAAHPMAAYASAKRAVARWVRRHATGPAWAGAGIALNAVAPGIVRTPMTEPMLADPAAAAYLHESVPMPFGGIAEPDAVVNAIEFLTAAATIAITGQVLFVDGGADCLTRGEVF